MDKLKEINDIGSLVKRKITMLGNPIDKAKKGEILEILGLAPCFGIVAKDSVEEIVYGAHLVIPNQDSIDLYFKEIPEESIARLKFITFGYIPMSRTAFTPGCLPDDYEKRYVVGFFSKLRETLKYIKQRYGISEDQFKFRDSLHNPKFRNFDSMGIRITPTGKAELYARDSKEGPSRLLETIEFERLKN